MEIRPVGKDFSHSLEMTNKIADVSSRTLRRAQDKLRERSF
jgi:hypothetical protein